MKTLFLLALKYVKLKKVKTYTRGNYLEMQ